MMGLMSVPIDPELMETAVTLLRQAGELTLTHFRNADLVIDRKGDGTPVTVADRAAERLLREELESRFPDDGILGEEEADTGTVERDEWTLVGFLPQESEDVGDHSVLEIATGRAGLIQELETTLKKHEDEGTVDSQAYYEAQSKFDALNDPSVDAKAKKMLRGLGYPAENFDRPAKEMSGGWIMRAHLARLLVIEPSLLMLDEPSMGLAPLLVNEVFAIIADIKAQGVPILLVEQNARKALQIADYVYVLERGVIVNEGAAADLRQDTRIIAAYLG